MTIEEVFERYENLAYDLDTGVGSCQALLADLIEAAGHPRPTTWVTEWTALQAQGWEAVAAWVAARGGILAATEKLWFGPLVDAGALERLAPDVEMQPGDCVLIDGRWYFETGTETGRQPWSTSLNIVSYVVVGPHAQWLFGSGAGLTPVLDPTVTIIAAYRLRPPAPALNITATVPVYIQFVPKMQGTVRPAAPTAVTYDPATQEASGLTWGWTQTLPPPTDQSYSVNVVLASLLTFAGPEPGPLAFRSAGPLQKLRGPWGERRLYAAGWGVPHTPLWRPLSATTPPGWAEGDLGADGSADGRVTFHYIRQRVGRSSDVDPQYPDDACWVGSRLPGLPRRPAALFSRDVAEPVWSDDEAGQAIAHTLPRLPLDRVFGRTTPDRWADSVRLNDCGPWLSAVPNTPLPPGSYLLAFDERKDGGLVYRLQPREPYGLTAGEWARYNHVQRFEVEAEYDAREVSLFISRRTRDGQLRPVDLVTRTAKRGGWELWPRSVGLRWTGQARGAERQHTFSYSLRSVSVDRRRDAWVVSMFCDYLGQKYLFPRAMADTIDILFSHRGIPTYWLSVPGDTVILHHTSGWTACRRMTDNRVWLPEVSTLGTDLAQKLYGGGG